MDTLILKLEVFKLNFKTVLGLFSARNSLVHRFNGLLCFCKSCSQLILASFQLINPPKSFSLEL